MTSTKEQTKSFAGFSYPRYAVFLPKGTPKQRLEKRKRKYTATILHEDGRQELVECQAKYEISGYFVSEPYPNNSEGMSFYLESDFMPGLRWQYCDQVEDIRGIDHSGWFTDEFGDGEKIRGIIMRLPHGRGFLPGWTMGEGMISTIDYGIYDDIYECAHRADRIAELAAEEERERDEENED